MRKSSWVIASVGAFVVLSGCNRGGDGYVAVVNGEGISYKDYHSYLERKPLVTVNVEGAGAQNLPVVGSIGFQAMRDLVNRRLLLQVAKDEGVSPTSADIEKEIEFQKKVNPDFVRDLTNRGMSIDEIKNDLAIDIAQRNVLTKGITITDKDVDDYIKGNPQSFVEPARVSLLWVVVDSEQLKARVDNDLRAGQNFRTVAARYSVARDARRTNGRYPLSVMNSDFPPRLRVLVERTPEFRATDWVRDGARWAKFYVEKKFPQKKMNMDATLRERVRRLIALDRGRQANDFGDRMQQQLRNAKVDVRESVLERQWKTAMEALTQGDATRGTEGAAGAPKEGEAAKTGE